jgi:DMSO/TMAO reductase YedYZ molybdopterin-dependent catalytic subunit
MSEKKTKAEWKRKSRRDFLVFGGLAAFGAATGTWILTRENDGGVPWPLRAMYRWNEGLWRRLYSSDRLGENPLPPPPGTRPRVNGDIGLEEYLGPVALKNWRLRVGGIAGEPLTAPAPAELSLEDLSALPQTEATEVFRCIEGWSQVIAYKGVRFSDLLAALQTRPGLRDAGRQPYVSLETPDGAYYVSLDRESMLHPKTVLATEMNGAPLSSENGAPLRLIVPVKYGIKSLKRIGRIAFSAERPPDYWAEQGYDWYAGL